MDVDRPLDLVLVRHAADHVDLAPVRGSREGPPAEGLLDGALSSKRDYVSAIVGQASLAMSRHDFAKARRLAERAVSLNRDIVSSYGVLADALVELGEYETAIQTLNTMVRMKPNLSSYSRISYIRELNGDTEGAIEAMSVAAAAYYAPQGIRINVIAPGLVQTPMTVRAQGNMEIAKYIVHKQPLRKGMLTAQDIAKTACFLLRQNSSPITGQVLTVDAGWTVSE